MLITLSSALVLLKLKMERNRGKLHRTRSLHSQILLLRTKDLTCTSTSLVLTDLITLETEGTHCDVIMLVII